MTTIVLVRGACGFSNIARLHCAGYEVAARAHFLLYLLSHRLVDDVFRELLSFFPRYTTHTMFFVGSRRWGKFQESFFRYSSLHYTLNTERLAFGR